MNETKDSAPPRRRGPIDNELWPPALSARVVEPGALPRIHGYAVQDDLARHYSFAELVLTCLTGTTPERNAGRAFEIALAFLAPVAVNEAPGHAAGLARLLGADTSGVLTGAAIGLAERARFVVAEQAELVAWLGAPSGPPPASARSEDSAEDAAVARLAEALAAADFTLPLLRERPTLRAALLGVLHAVGLVEAGQLQAALLIAGLPATIAEGLAATPFAFFSYPMDLPAFRYVEDRNG